MNKRIAYIGLSYPSLYDYKYQATKTNNDLSDSPNPIIDSPLGLMVLYDELWFLCESLCPNNMRQLPYVKFVDKMFPNLWFEGANQLIENKDYENLPNERLSYREILQRMNMQNRSGLDLHTHALKIGSVFTYSNGRIENYLFDLYVVSALQNFTNEDIEMVSNSNYHTKEQIVLNSVSELTENLIIPNIPNYLSIDGPYHECIEDLRENTYLKDFRKWVITNHNNIQHNEIKDICSDVSLNIQETQKNVFKKHLESNNKFSFFKSTSKTCISTAGGFLHPMVSIILAGVEITSNAKNRLEVKSDRWQGFIIDAQDTIKINKLTK